LLKCFLFIVKSDIEHNRLAFKLKKYRCGKRIKI
jgi:hypothetical protein